MTNFPPGGPWVYDSVLPKPSAGTNTVKSIIEFSSTDVKPSSSFDTSTALETLHDLLVQYNIINTLSDISTKYTVLAPNSNAFVQFNSVFSTLTDVQKTDILKSHVVLGNYDEAGLQTLVTNGTEVSTLSCTTLKFIRKESDNKIYVVAKDNMSKIVNSDFLATNGVVHHIESVLEVIDPFDVTKGVIFAQLQINTVNITESTSHKVELFDVKIKDDLTQVAEYYGITGNNMRELFYKYSKEFGMPILQTAMSILTNSKHLIKGWRHSSGECNPVENHGYNLIKEAVNLWEQDVCLTSDKWSRSSYIDITRELMITDKWTELNNCNIGNALSYSQLIESINQHLGKYSIPQTKLLKDNKLILSMLISNGNANTKPVELLLHFVITEDESS
tara:strand:+ start:175 stop:1344 length:1170 start_codon:yes stop_codon:yes gene_type:complete